MIATDPVDNALAKTFSKFLRTTSNQNLKNDRLWRCDRFCQKIVNKYFVSPNIELTGIVRNAFWQSFAPIGAMFEGQTADRSSMSRGRWHARSAKNPPHRCRCPGLLDQYAENTSRKYLHLLPRGGPLIPPTPNFVGHVGPMLAHFSVLGAS